MRFVGICKIQSFKEYEITYVSVNSITDLVRFCTVFPRLLAERLTAVLQERCPIRAIN